MAGLPNDADAKKVIKKLSDAGWVYDDSVGSSSHLCGFLLCGSGCKVWVTRTGKNSARAIMRDARRCPHGMSPRGM